MDRAPITVFNSTTKLCVDCAHFEASSEQCLQSKPIVNPVTGATRRMYAESMRIDGCGPEAKHFTPTDKTKAQRSINRIHLQQAIEDSISQLHPDNVSAQEILDALTASLESRYEENAEDALNVAAEFRDALNELEEPEVGGARGS